MLSREFSTNNKSLCCILEPNVVCQLCCCCSITVISNSVTPWTVARPTPLFSITSQSLLRFMPVEMVMLSDHLILCCPLILLPSIFPSIRVFSSKLALYINCPKYWIVSFSISSSNKYSGLISFRMD